MSAAKVNDLVLDIRQNKQKTKTWFWNFSLSYSENVITAYTSAKCPPESELPQVLWEELINGGSHPASRVVIFTFDNLFLEWLTNNKSNSIIQTSQFPH